MRASVGITTPFVSNDVVKEMRYPDALTGDPSTTEKDAFTYNRQADVVTKTDRNGNVHTFTFDILGRVVSDAINCRTRASGVWSIACSTSGSRDSGVVGSSGAVMDGARGVSGVGCRFPV